MGTLAGGGLSRVDGLWLRHEADVLAAQLQVRAFCRAAGLDPARTEALVTAASELARNALVYAGSGELLVAIVQEGRRRSVRVCVRDRGPGIADLELALLDGYTTGTGLGLGLPSARRLTDRLQVETGADCGTTVTVTTWLP